jgi:transcription factor SPT20
MAPSATTTQSMSSKIKRPVPPGIQTNGINSSTSSPSPSMSASRLPSGSKVAPNSATSNGVGNSSAVRSANRSRREAPPQLLGRGQRNGSVGLGLRSGSIVGDSVVPQTLTPQPYGTLSIQFHRCVINMSGSDIQRLYLAEISWPAPFSHYPPPFHTLSI